MELPIELWNHIRGDIHRKLRSLVPCIQSNGCHLQGVGYGLRHDEEVLFTET